MKKFFLFIVVAAIVLFHPSVSRAQTDVSRPAITVMNIVRGNGLGHERDDLLTSLQAQWQVTKDENINATWLFQYGALENKGITAFAKQEMKGQEFGLLFEIDNNFAKKAGVQFRGQGAWYFSDGLLLVSYDVGERRRLIDTAFAKFKDVFGYYPKTVGAWWIGGDSLTYMQKRYGITSALRAADQFNLDFYSIWGTPWDIPYLASKNNEGMPAASYSDSSKVVMLQWAIRDPLRGYADPIYSLEDYSMKGYASDYIDHLASIYLQNPFGNMVMGVENGGTLEQFEDSYKTKLTVAKEMAIKYNATIELSKDYAARFLLQHEVFPSNTYFLSTDYNSSDQAFWYLSDHYRVAIHKIQDDIALVDLRNYSNKTAEDFEILPNTQSRLRITEPDFVDSMRFPNRTIHIASTGQALSVKERGHDVELYAGNDLIAKFTRDTLTIFQANNLYRTFIFQQVRVITLIQVISLLCILYFGIIFIYKKNIRASIKDCVLLLLPLCLAFPFLKTGPTFLFDKKETFILLPLAAIRIFPILTTIYVVKILPIVVLFLTHYLCIIKFPGKIKKQVFMMLYILTLFLYLHLPYFPLDKTTYGAVLLCLGAMGVISIGILVFMMIRTRSIKKFVVYFGGVFMVLLLITVTVVVSRSKFALTVYEIDALQFIKNQKKDVVLVDQADYSIRPIYKEVKPILYMNLKLEQEMTGKKWNQVMRPENHILQLSHYDNKIIVIPRYLGSDLSDYEISLLQLKKVFDNAQIAIYEKN